MISPEVIYTLKKHPVWEPVLTFGTIGMERQGVLVYKAHHENCYIILYHVISRDIPQKT